MPNTVMPALSVRQPWAWLLTHALKDVENRTWPTGFSGWFLIHAGKKFDPDGLCWVQARFPQIALPDSFDMGGIVGVARKTKTVTTSTSPWFVGPYGFMVCDARPLPFKQLPGRLGFFAVSLDDGLSAALHIRPGTHSHGRGCWAVQWWPPAPPAAITPECSRRAHPRPQRWGQVCAPIGAGGVATMRACIGAGGGAVGESASPRRPMPTMVHLV